MPALATEEVEEKELSAWQTIRWALEFDTGLDVQVLARSPADHRLEYIVDMGVVRAQRKAGRSYYCGDSDPLVAEHDMVLKSYRVGVAGKWSPWQPLSTVSSLAREDTFRLQSMALLIEEF